MTAEFTGERVIPGQVDADLWNEHFARYAFAHRLASGKRVLDAGCGAGYGSAELASVADSVVGIDLAQEAIQFAGANYQKPRYLQASCAELPFRESCFDLVVMYEVIEHVREWARLIQEARRVLSPDGYLIVSTPNKSFYAETRRDSGPNPFHEHEFEYDEFRAALGEAFRSVTMFLEDHTEGVVFRPAAGAADAAARVQETDASPEDSSFFIAICGDRPLERPSSFVYVPRSSNLLREKLLHVQRLEGEVRTKDEWIAQEQAAHQQLLQRHGELRDQLEKSNLWATQTAADLDQARLRIAALQDDYARQQKESQEMADAYEVQIAELNRTVQERTDWAQETERRLTEALEECAADRDRQIQDLAACVELLHRAEATAEERTRWALQLDATLNAARASRWIRLGRAIGLGPELQGH